MKRTPLKRKTPLKSKSGLKSHSALQRKTPLKRTELKRNGPAKGKTASKARGLQGIGRSAKEIYFHNKVAALGCIACEKLKTKTIFPIRIHHVKGRKQAARGDYSEWWVLPLCDQHHNPQLAFAVNGIQPDLEAPSVHCRHKLFIAQIGTQESLVEEVYDKLGIAPPFWDETAHQKEN